MQLKELLQPADFCVGFVPVDKWDAIDFLMAHLQEVGRIEAEQLAPLREKVLERERSMSTGMERGIAIPHAAVDGLDQVVACVGVVQREEGLPFESIDGQPAHVIVLLLIPRAQKLLHIRTLADIARILGKDAVRAALRTVPDAQAAWDVIAQAEGQAV